MWPLPRKRSTLENTLPKPVLKIIDAYRDKTKAMDTLHHQQPTEIAWDRLAEKAIAFRNRPGLDTGEDVKEVIREIREQPQTPAYITDDFLRDFVQAVADSLQEQSISIAGKK